MRLMKRHAAGIAACVALAAWAGARAESLADAWRMAAQGDAGLGAARSEVEAAESEHAAASRSRLPVVDATGSYTQFANAPGLDVSTPSGGLQAPIWKNDRYLAGTIDVSVPLWTSGRIGGAIGAAKAYLEGARAQQIRTAADLKLAVVDAYIGVFRARRLLAVAESNVKSLQSNADDIGVMFERESVPKADLLSARVALANAEQQRLHAAHGLRLAMATYNRQIGQPLDRAAELDEPAAVPSVAAGESVEAMIARALENRPELATLVAERDGLQQSARSKRAEALPELSLHAGYSHLDSEILDRENFAAVGIAFRWRLFDSGQVAASADALESRARAVERRLEDLRSKIALEVETAALDRDDAAARLSAAREAVGQAEENVRSARELYGSGLATGTQVLEAESLRVAAFTNRDNAEFDLLISGYRILRAIGDL